MESRVQEALARIPPASGKSAIEAMEHLALLARWFYRSTRTGEIFFTDAKGALPLRRLVRGISRVYRGESPALGWRRPRARDPPCSVCSLFRATLERATLEQVPTGGKGEPEKEARRR